MTGTRTNLTRMIDQILEQGLRRISVIGLAKNTGKTVTLNALAAKAHEAGLRTALVSFGRDGEQVDAITRLDKPRIKIYPGMLFVTAERFVNPAIVDISAEMGTEIPTVYGEARVYTGGATGGTAELIGINRVSSLKKVLGILEDHVDLILIDGALDRRSSAIPRFSDGCILATGAVLGRDEGAVIRATVDALERLRIPGVDDSVLRRAAAACFDRRKHGVVNRDGTVEQFDDLPEAVTRCLQAMTADAIVLRGAVTNRVVETLVERSDTNRLLLVVRDATRVFLDGRHIAMAASHSVVVRVIDPIRVLALTVNPTRPHMPDMDSRQLVAELRERYANLCCFDVVREG